jgi:hypothetical protein
MIARQALQMLHCKKKDTIFARIPSPAPQNSRQDWEFWRFGSKNR